MLTPQLRAYLKRCDRRLLLVDLVRDLTGCFNLTPEQAGRAIADSIMEDFRGEAEQSTGQPSEQRLLVHASRGGTQSDQE